MHDSVIWGECTEAIQAKIKLDDNYEALDQDSNSLDLNNSIAYKFESQQNIYLAFDKAKCLFCAYQQAKDKRKHWR